MIPLCQMEEPRTGSSISDTDTAELPLLPVCVMGRKPFRLAFGGRLADNLGDTFGTNREREDENSDIAISCGIYWLTLYFVRRLYR